MNDKDFKRARNIILGIFVPIIGLIIWFLNTDYHIKKEYLKFKELGFNATVSAKFDENPVRANLIYLKNGPQLKVYRKLFDQLKIGDSVVKKVNSDSIFFYSSNGLIIDDYNQFLRKKYLKTLEQ
ncbi:hypothetical protein [Flagellimonas sp.]|uniref:hypothetical protein n=1 Tax=Flagellimonas sp. TaxID=2058762 RepID=UPI003BA99FBC